MKYPPVNYYSYLQLDKILDAQFPVSKKFNQEVHDETLFVLVHQSFELWFKQILHDVDSIIKIFDTSQIPDQDLYVVVSRLNRIKKIQSLFAPHIEILETMTPMDFLEFRDMLIPASGFQSFQFRLIETKFGLKDRHTFDQVPYYNRLEAHEKERMLLEEKKASLFELVQNWLTRMPFVNAPDFNFESAFGEAVKKMLKNEEDLINSQTGFTNADKQKQLKILAQTKENFEAIIDESKYNSLLQSGQRRLGFKATQASLMIFMYRDIPVFQIPFQILNSLIEIDENWTSWRARHALMVQRMIGMKIGTGGSAGHDYLRATTDKHRVYQDFVNLSTFLIPRKLLPVLPKSLLSQMTFGYNVSNGSKPVSAKK